MTERIALIVEYAGLGFHGWQRQANEIPTVQAKLETALAVVAAEEVRIVCAGRTDARVHATKQVVHFDTSASRPNRAWVHGVNAHLPDGIAVQSAHRVALDFHARFGATARRYRYLIHNVPIRSGLIRGFTTREHRPLATGPMHMAAQSLLGEQDFTSLRAARCQSATPWRNVMRSSVWRNGDLVVLDFTANAFLLHMVRNVAGVLMDIGAGLRPTNWLRELLDLRDREAGSVTASPDGLYLIDVAYPARFGLPAGPRLPHVMDATV